MPSKLRARLTYANVMATIAVFIALGGSSYAAIKVTGKNVKDSSLTGKDIKNNSVTGRDVKGIKSGDVADRSLLAKDFKSGQVPQGPQGDKGDPGAAKVTVRVGSTLTPGTNASGAGCVDGTPGGSTGYHDGTNTAVTCAGGVGGSAATTVSCQSGERATGGGYSADKRHALITENHPTPTGAAQPPTGWHVKVESLTESAANVTTVTPYAVCVGP